MVVVRSNRHHQTQRAELDYSLEYKSAEECMRLTIVALKLSPKDAEFLERAMQDYAALRINEETETADKP